MSSSGIEGTYKDGHTGVALMEILRECSMADHPSEIMGLVRKIKSSG